MKKNLFVSMMTAMAITTATSSPAFAVTCLAPHPFCAVVIGLQLLVGAKALNSTDQGSPAVKEFVARENIEAIMADEAAMNVMRALITNDSIMRSIIPTDKNLSDFESLILAVDDADPSKQVEKFESLKKYTFAIQILDEVDAEIVKATSAQVVDDNIGPKYFADGSVNYDRYKKIALIAFAVKEIYWKLK